MKKRDGFKYKEMKIPPKSVLLNCFFLCMLCVTAAGCSSDSIPEDSSADMVIIDHEEEEFAYPTVTVSVEDVVRTARVNCNYRQAEESEINISMIGRTLDKVYVKEGDHVTEGQLLAMLSGGDQDARVRELEYHIARNQLLLDYTELDEEYDLSYRWWTYLYRTSMSKQDAEQLEKDLAAIRERYRYLREDYQDAIDLDAMELALIQEEMEQCRIYADKTGEISYLNPYLLGAVITEEKNLMKIFDRSQCIFESTQTIYASCFQEGTPVELTVSSGGNTVYLEVTPTKMNQWDEKMYFEVTSGDTSSVAMGALGHIPITVDSRTQVLAVPNSCVHNTYDDQYYVYVLNSNNVRETKLVTPGLRGDDMTEITDGLTEGEQILLQ